MSEAGGEPHLRHLSALAIRPVSKLKARTDRCVCRMLDHFQDLQIRPQSQRLQILELLNDLMLQQRLALKELGEEFIVGVTDLVSGEKDPRNLMIIFSVLKAVMIEWDISKHAEVGRFSSF